MDCFIYTDGSADNNGVDGAPGGWAVVMLSSEGHRKEDAGLIQHPDARPTNQAMELQAAIKGLQMLKRPQNFEQAVLYTDSQYVITMSVSRSRNPANRFLVEELREEIKRIRKVIPLRFEHVPGHAGVEHNERAHELAFEQYQKGLSNAGVTDESELESKIKFELDRRQREAEAAAAAEWLKTASRSEWRADSIRNVEVFQKAEARFYPYVLYNIGDPEAQPTVMVGQRKAYLLAVRTGFCHVSFYNERRWNPRKKGENKWEYGDMQLIPHEEVIPIG